MARDISKLHPKLREKLSLLISECMKVGLNIKVTECVRTVQEQDNLYTKGRTVAGPKVTNAKGSTYSSMHQWGVAFDFCRNDGRGLYDNSDGFFRKVGRIGQSIGLQWGAEWNDLPHFQLSNWGSRPDKLIKKYKTPEAFIKSWERQPDANTQIENKVLFNKEIVGIVQQWTVDYSGHKIGIDCSYGKETRKNIIRCLQKSLNLPQTGIENSALYINFRTVSNKLEDVGSGNVVKCIESLLFVHNYNPQEYTGNCTESVCDAISKFQKEFDLTPDGRCGDNTLRQMLKS